MYRLTIFWSLVILSPVLLLILELTSLYTLHLLKEDQLNTFHARARLRALDAAHLPINMGGLTLAWMHGDVLSAIFHLVGGGYYLWKYHLGREKGGPMTEGGGSDAGSSFGSSLRFLLGLDYVASHRALQSNRIFRKARREYATRFGITALVFTYVVYCAALFATGALMFSMQRAVMNFGKTHFHSVGEALDRLQVKHQQ